MELHPMPQVPPQNGRSALDGVEAMNYMVNLMREHVPMETRIHYVITRGGEAPNVVPAYAEVFYYVRHPDAPMVKELFERVVQAAEGAAQGTGTRMEYEVIHGLYNLMPNETLAEKMYRNLKLVGGVNYTREEEEFAEKIIESYKFTTADISTSSEIEPYEVILRGRGGSTDVGDVSWVVPTAGMRAATWVPGTSAHSWQAVAAGGTTIGTKGMMVAAKTMALTIMDLFGDPSIIEKSQRRAGRQAGWSRFCVRTFAGRSETTAGLPKIRVLDSHELESIVGGNKTEFFIEWTVFRLAVELYIFDIFDPGMIQDVADQLRAQSFPPVTGVNNYVEDYRFVTQIGQYSRKSAKPLLLDIDKTKCEGRVLQECSDMFSLAIFTPPFIAIQVHQVIQV